MFKQYIFLFPLFIKFLIIFNFDNTVLEKKVPKIRLQNEKKIMTKKVR